MDIKKIVREVSCFFISILKTFAGKNENSKQMYLIFINDYYKRMLEKNRIIFHFLQGQFGALNKLTLNK